jgi:hypothetical protein
MCTHPQHVPFDRENYDERLKCMRLMFSDKKTSIKQKDDNRKLLPCLIACRSTFFCSRAAK